ncbi:hypothetical protein ACJRO7_018138 [Eucalyptus globulus]|uniref:DUF4220 domain-containing protein n=1 Tax=Eucalyptus globulus TaxID=34317 RepID=A0ABD3KSM0_EUCGL
MRNLQSSQMGAVNETTGITKKLHILAVSLAKIELFVCLTALLLILGTFFGLLRHWYTNRMLKIALLALYTIPSLANAWSLGHFSDYNLEDNGQQINYSWEHLLRNISLAKMLIFSVRNSKVSWAITPNFRVISGNMLVLHTLFLIVKLKDNEKTKSVMTASRNDVQRTIKLISQYISSEHQSSDPRNLDPIQMRGYNYVVRGEETRWVNGSPLKMTDEIITVDRVRACQGPLLSSRGGDEYCKLKDICLSFCSHSLSKEAHKKLWKLIRNGLVAEENGYTQECRVIELELSFMFDSFYTKYPIIFQSGHWKQKLMEISLISLMTILPCFLSYKSGVGLLLTLVILTACTCVELLEFFLMAISQRARVSLLCKYVRTRSWQGNKRIEKTIGLICRTQLLKPWERKLRQTCFSSHMVTALRGGYAFPPELVISIASGRVKNKALQPNFIIVWHIVTTICEHEVQISDSNFLVVTTLSKYLAYSVAFCPKLLFDCPDDTEYVFDQTVLQSRDLLEGCKTGEERILKLKGIGSVTNLGARLGQQLLKDKADLTFIWKVLADFWAEPMVYEAPSDYVKAHAENLAMGGEFVTHFLALVSHANIKREPPVGQPTLKRCQS